MADHTWTLEEVAAELQRKPATLQRTWRKLHRDHGFPRPLPGMGLLWSRALVLAWIRGAAMSSRPANDDAPGLPGPDVDSIIAQQREALRNRPR